MSDKALRLTMEMDSRASLPTIAGRLALHVENSIDIENLYTMRHRTDSGFMSASSIVSGEPEGEYIGNPQGPLPILRDLGRLKSGYAHKSQQKHTVVYNIGHLHSRYKVGEEGRSRELQVRGRKDATMTLGNAKASHDNPEINRRFQSPENGFCFEQPASRFSRESNSRRSFISTPSLFSSDLEKMGSDVVSVSQADLSSFAASERSIPLYAIGGERWESDYSTFAEANSDMIIRSDSRDSALCLGNPYRSRTSRHSSAPSQGCNSISALEAPEREAGRTNGPVGNSCNIQNATSVLPASHPSIVETDHAVTPRRRVQSPDVLLIRNILGVASYCIPHSVPRKKSAVNPAYLPESLADAYGPSAENKPIPQLRASAPPEGIESSPADSSDMSASQQPVCVDFTQCCSLEKNDFLTAFDMMCKEARHTGINVVGRVIQISNFAAAMLDSQGGFLSIDDLDVHLYVTPGAIPKGPPQLVYIFVQGNLNSSKSSLTPCVHCGPSTLRFEKDVILTFPHCAQDAKSYRFTCVKSMTGGIPREIRDGEDGVILVDTKSITVTMDHFCGYSANAPIFAKYMIACVFIKEDTALGKAWIRVRLFDNSKANLQEVKKSEWRLGFSLADMGHMELHRSTTDVLVALRPEDESWKITEPKSGQRTLQHSILWLDNSPDLVPAFPSALFYASCNSPRKAPFQARIRLFQEDRENHDVNFFVKMPVQPDCHKADIASNVSCTPDEDIRRVFFQMMNQLHIHSTPVRPGTIPDGIYKRLCDVLDPPLPIPGDWRSLPELLPGLEGFGCRWITSIETRAGREDRSPTQLILDTFFAKSEESGKKAAHTLRDLRQGLLSLKRQDVQFAIDAIGKQLDLKRVDMDVIKAKPKHDRDSNNNTGRGYCSMTSVHQPSSNKVDLSTADEPDFKIEGDGVWDGPKKTALILACPETLTTKVCRGYQAFHQSALITNSKATI